VTPGQRPRRQDQVSIHGDGGFSTRGLHPKSEIPDQPITDTRKPAVEWTARL